MKRRHSRQRDAILEYLQGTYDHPTAEQIHEAIRKDIPNISLGTVYRNLALLEELGQVNRISCGSNAEHFDADMSSHQHLLCEKCGAVVDIHIDCSDIDRLASKGFAGTISSHTIVFRGICEQCCAAAK